MNLKNSNFAAEMIKKPVVRRECMRSWGKIKSAGFCIGFALAMAACVHTVGRGEARTDEEIQAVFDQNKRELYIAYQEALRERPELSGRLLLRIVIEPSGLVSMCDVEKVTFDDDVGLGEAICIKIRGFDFGEKNTERLSLTYPIDFIPR